MMEPDGFEPPGLSRSSPEDVAGLTPDDLAPADQQFTTSSEPPNPGGPAIREDGESPRRTIAVWVAAAVAGCAALVLLVSLVGGWLNGDVRVRRQLAGSWEANVRNVPVYKGVRARSVFIKCRFAADTNSRGENLLLNIMPADLSYDRVSVPLPDVLPTLRGVWKVRQGQLVLRIDKVDLNAAKWIIPLLEAATGGHLLHQELTLSISSLDGNRLVLDPGLVFERTGR